MHGALGHKEQLFLLKEKLHPLVDAIPFDFSGHGSDMTDPVFSIDLFTEDTLRFIEANQFENINIFGYSMGGYVALSLALRHPEKVNKIITLATKFEWTPESAAKEVQRLNPEFIEEKFPAFVEDLKKRHANHDWKNIVSKTTDMMTELGNGKAFKPSDFEKIHHQVMICIGSEDKMVSTGESAFVAGLLENGMLQVIPGFKHPLETNDQDLLADIIYHFIAIPNG